MSQEHTPNTLWFDAAMNRETERAQRFRRLWQMTPAQRAAAMYRGELTYAECSAWANRHPDQVPLLNGEFWHIAISTPEACE